MWETELTTNSPKGYILLFWSIRLGYTITFMRQAVTSSFLTLGRRQSKRLSTINKLWSKIDRNSVFDSHLLSDWRQMAIENSVSNNFLSTFLDSIGIFDCRLPGVFLYSWYFCFCRSATEGWMLKLLVELDPIRKLKEVKTWSLMDRGWLLIQEGHTLSKLIHIDLT